MQWVQMISKGVGTLGEGIAQKDNASIDRKTEDENARNLDTLASQIGQAGTRNEEHARREYRRFAGMQFGTIAESGLGNEGSALDVVRQSEAQAYLDELNIRHDSGSRIRAVRYEASQARARSALAKEMEKRARYKIIAESTGVIGNTDKFVGISGKGPQGSSQLNTRLAGSSGG